MFQKLLGTILNRVLGQYLQGIDQNNLKVGLWSGDVVLQNVRFNKHLIQMLNLPLKIIYSKIGRLKLKIPWKSIQSTKTQVQLDGLYMVISPEKQQDWKFVDHKLIEQKIKEINAIVKNCIQNFKGKKNKENQKQSSYSQKLVLKIIDNIQIKIQNIHICVQNNINKVYSFGVIMKHLQVSTIDQNGEKRFIDRTDPKYKGQPLKKIIQLQNFGVYWDTNPTILIDMEQQKILYHLTQSINGSIKNIEQSYILRFSSYIRLYQNEKGQFKHPEIDFKVNLKSLNINIQKHQLQQIISLMQFFHKYKKKLKYIQSKKKITTVQQLKMQINNFKKLLQIKIRKQQQDQNYQLQKYNYDSYVQIITSIDTQLLKPTIMQVIKILQKEKLIKEKQQSKGGWFSYFKSNTQQLEASQVDQIEKFMNQNFSAQSLQVNRPEDYHYIVLRLLIDQGKFCFTVDQKQSKNLIELRFFNINAQFNLRQKGFLFTFKLSNAIMNLIQCKENQINKIQIFTKNTQYQIDFISVLVDSNPIKQKHIDLSIQAKFQPIVIYFNPKLIDIILKFADVKIKQDTTNAVWDQYDQLSNMAAINMNDSLQLQKLMKLNLQINAPVIYIPHRCQNYEFVWLLNMGVLKIQTDNSVLDPNIPRSEKTQDIFNLGLSKVMFICFENDDYTGKVINRKNEINIINQFEINLRLFILKIKNKKIEQPKIKLQGKLPNLILNIMKFNFQKLSQIGLAFQSPQSTKILKQKQLQQQIQKKQVKQEVKQDKIKLKQQILRTAQKTQRIYLQGYKIKTWNKYIAVLNDNYIYFYQTPKSTDYLQCIWIKNSDIKVNKDYFGMKFSITVVNKYNQIILGFDKQSSLEKWKQLIEKKRNMQMMLNLLDQQEKKNQKKEIVNPTNLNLKISFEIANLQLNINQQNSKIVSIVFRKTILQIYNYQKQLNIIFKNGSFNIYDFVYMYKIKQIESLLVPLKQGEDLLIVNFKKSEPQHPQFKQTDIEIFVQLKSLNINYKPQVISALMNFINIQSTKPSKPPLKLKSLQISNISQTNITINATQKLLIRIHVNINGIGLSLVNSNCKIPICQINLTSGKVELEQYIDYMVLKCEIGNIQLIDLSNFPETITDQNEFEKVKPREYLGLCKQDQNQNLIQLKLKMFKQQSSRIVNNVNMIIDIQVNKIDLQYFQQPILRYLQYLNSQLLFSLNPNQPVITKIPDPLFSMQLKINVNRPRIKIPAKITQEQWIEVITEKIIITNHRQLKKCVEDSDQNMVVDHYIIDIVRVQIGLKRDVLRNCTLPFDINLDVQLIQFIEIYKPKYKQKLDEGMRVNLYLQPFLLRLRKIDYLFIMKCLFFNISYDDMQTSKLYPPQQINISQQVQFKQSPPMYIFIFIENISLFTLNQNHYPFARITVDQICIDFIKYPKKNKILIKILEILSSNFKYKNEVAQQIGLIGNLNHYCKYKLEQILNLQTFKKYIKETTKSGIQKIKNNKNYMLQIQMDLFLNGKKEMLLIINGLNIMLQVKPLLMLSTFASLDQSVIPPPILQKKDDEIKETIPDNSQMIIDIKIKGLFACVGIQSEKQVLAIKSDFLINFKLMAEPTVQMIEKDLNEKKINYNNAKQVNQYGNIYLSINCMSIFICDLQQILKKGFEKVTKRELLQPFNMQIIQKQFISYELNNKNEKIIFIRNFNYLNLQDIKLKFTLSDINFSTKIMNAKLKDLDTDKQKVNQNQKQDKNDLEVLNMLATISKNQLLSIEQKIEILQKTKIIQNQIKIELQTIVIQLIINTSGQYIPILRIDIYQNTPLIKFNDIKTEVSLSLFLSIDYFNPIHFNMEPVLQPCRMNIIYLSSQFTQVKNTIAIQAQQGQQNKIQLIITTRFLELLLHLKNQIQKAYKEYKQQYINQEKEVILTSCFLFKNETNLQFTIEYPKQYQKKLNKDKDIVGNIQFKLSPKSKKSIPVPVYIEKILLQNNNNNYTIHLNKISGRKLFEQINYQSTMQGLTRCIIISTKYQIINKLQKDLVIINNNIEQTINKDGHINLLYNDIQQIKFGINDKYSKSIKLGQLIKQNIDKAKKLNENETEINMYRQHIYYVQIEEMNIGLWIVFDAKKNQQKKQIFVFPPYILYNYLPRNIFVNIQVKSRNINLTKHIDCCKKIQEYSIPHYISMLIKINMPGFFWAKPIIIFHKGNYQLQIKDSIGNHILVDVHLVEKFKSYQLIFFCKGCIRNQTPYNLTFLGIDKKQQNKNKKQFFQLPGQNIIQKEQKFVKNIVLIGKNHGDLLKIYDKNLIKSATQIPQLKIAGIQTTQYDTNVYENQTNAIFTTLAAQVSIKSISTYHNIICKQIRITPRYIINNLTDHDIIIKQMGVSIEKAITIKGQKRERLLWSQNKQNKMIEVKFVEGEDCSIPLNCHQIGTTYFTILRNKEQIFMKSELREDKPYIFIIIEEIEKIKSPYRVENDMYNIQVFCQTLYKKVDFWQPLNYCLMGKIRFTIKHPLTHKQHFITINPDNPTQFIDYKFDQNNLEDQMHIYIDFDGFTKIIRFESMKDHKAKNQQLKKINKKEQKLCMKFANIGISIVFNDEASIQLFYIYMKNLEIFKQNATLYQQMQMKVQFLQIDQNNKRLVSFPVLITPIKFSYIKPQEKKNMLNFYVKQQINNTDTVIYQAIQLQVDPFVFKFTQQLQQLIYFILEKVNKFYGIQYKMVQEDLQSSWAQRDIPKYSYPTYVKKILISTLVIDLKIQYDLKEKQNPFFGILGVTLGNIQSVIKYFNLTRLNGISLQNCFDSFTGLYIKLYKHYKMNIIKIGLQMLGSLNIIGNPVSLLNNISTGFNDIIQMPKQGIVEGPLQAGLGIAKGAGSLITHTAAGAFDSINKITGTVSSGITKLCFDKQFEKQRQNARNKTPKHVLSGLKMGAESIGKGFTKGILGIFLKPYQGAKKEGALGFLKGVGQGVTGLVIKPVTGILDFASKTTQGVKNTLLLYQQKPNQNRMRCPRAFYGYNHLIKQYNELDAQVLDILQLLQKGLFSNVRLVQAIMIMPNLAKEEQKYILVISLQYLIYLSLKKKKEEWWIQMSKVMDVLIHNQQLKIISLNRFERLKQKEVSLMTNNKQTNEIIIKTIKQTQKLIELLK